MKHKITKFKSDGRNEKEWVAVFILTAQYNKFKKGEIFEEFYTSGKRFYAISSNLFDMSLKNGHTKIIMDRETKKAPVSFFKKIRKEDSMLYKLHNEITPITPVEYHPL